MTDQQKFLNLMNDFDIIVEEPIEDEINGIKVLTFAIKEKYSANKNDVKQDGYASFFCDWSFDIQGNFLKMGIWE